MTRACEPDAAPLAPAPIAALLWPWVPLVAVLLGALAMRDLATPNADVTWLITLAEKALAGERLYVDVWEINPPASIFLYVVPVALAHLAGVPPELVVDSAVFGAAGASLWLAGRILTRAGLLDSVDRPSVTALAALILTVVPAHIFGQREHIVVIAVLPALAVLAARATGRTPELAAIVVAGISAGIVMVVKPYFVLAIGPATLAVAVSTRSLRALFIPESWIAGSIVVLYGAVVVFAYPHYIDDVVPIAGDTYLALRLSLWTLLGRLPAGMLWATAIGLIVLAHPRTFVIPAFRPILAAAFGFGLAYLVQGKGWGYHAYPAIALALLVLAIAWTSRPTAAPSLVGSSEDRIKRVSIALLSAVVVASTTWWMSLAVDLSDLVRPIRASKANPTMLAISSDIAVGHPLTRQVGGRWVSRVASLWITAGVLNRRTRGPIEAATAARLDRHAAHDRATLIDDISRERPDIILVDRAPFDWLAWAERDPALSRLLQNYHEVATSRDVLVLRHAS
jgi:hypothetical protein